MEDITILFQNFKAMVIKSHGIRMKIDTLIDGLE